MSKAIIQSTKCHKCGLIFTYTRKNGRVSRRYCGRPCFLNDCKPYQLSIK